MADFSFLSDSDDDSTAIEELISQAKDLSVLEQITAINCSSFTTLPTDLETRFRKLKSFPVAATTKQSHHHHSIQNQNHFFPSPKQHSPDSADLECNPPQKVETPDRKKGTKFINSTDQNAVFKPFEGTPPDQKRDSSELKPKSESRPVITSPTNSSNSSNSSLVSTYLKVKSKKRVSNSSSPPVKRGCFWCSPKSLLKKKNKKKQDDEDGQEILSGLTKEQKRLIQKVVEDELTKEHNRVIQKAIKEDEKINREVDKIVTWAKRASSRMIDFDLQDGQISHDDTDYGDDDDDDIVHDDDGEYDVFK